MPSIEIELCSTSKSAKSLPSISVVLPARNSETTLSTAVESILAQTVSDFELVLVDHASTDSTLGLMQQYAHRDSRVKVERCKGTFIEAVNQAWHGAGGDLIVRMDADDFSDPNRLEIQRSFLLENPHLSCCSSLVKIQKKDKQTGKISPPDEGYAEYEKWINSVVSPEQISRERFVDSPIPNPASMIRREILEEFEGYRDTIWAEDYDLWLRILQAGHHLGKVDQILLNWYDGTDRATRTQSRYSQENFQRAKAHFLAQLPQVRESGVAICGAGPVGKTMMRFLKAEKIRVHSFFEVNERQIGNQIDNIPVRNSLEMGNLLGKCVLVAAVGQRGARTKLQSQAKEAGYTEGVDFFCAA